jgi:hypothetical protein
MSWSSATPADATRTFDEYVAAHLSELQRDLRSFLEPILDAVAPLHTAGAMHGGLFPAALRYNDRWELDAELLKSQRRAPGDAFPPHVGLGNRAPESIALQDETVRSDCYALGALLYQIITGHPPAPAARRAPGELLAAANFPEWPAQVLAMVNRSLAIEPSARPATAMEIWGAAVRPPGAQVAPGAEPVQEVTMPDVLLSHPPEPAGTAETESASTEGVSAAKAEPQPTPGEPILDANGDTVTVPEMVLNPPLPMAPEPAPLPVDEPRGEPTGGNEPAPPTNLFTVPETAAHYFPMKVQPHERLANGSVGKPYSQSIRDLFGGNAHRLVTAHVDVPADHGLVFYEQSLELSGTPTVPGEFKLSMSFRLKDSPPDRLPEECELWLTINPDPKSLWKNLPSDADGLFAKPDQATDSLTTLELTALAASQRGRSHAHSGKYRDDDFMMRQIGATGWHIFFVADGAGSAKYSRRGSQIAAETTRVELEAALGVGDRLDQEIAALGGGHDAAGLEKVRGVVFEILASAANAALKAILAQAEELTATDPEATPRNFSTTYIAVLAKRCGPRWFFGSFAIGDGGAGILLKDGRVELLTQPDSGEFAGQTVFLNSPGLFENRAALLSRAKAFFCDDFHFLAVMSDGITDPIFQSDAQLASPEVWQAWHHRLREKFAIDAPAPGMEQALLEYLNFFEAGNHDDRTLLVAVPTGHSAPA